MACVWGDVREPSDAKIGNIPKNSFVTKMTSSQETKITAAFSYIKNVGKHILFKFNYDLLGYKRALDNPTDFAWFTDVFHS